MEDITDGDYEHIQRAWKDFEKKLKKKIVCSKRYTIAS